MCRWVGGRKPEVGVPALCKGAAAGLLKVSNGGAAGCMVAVAVGAALGAVKAHEGAPASWWLCVEAIGFGSESACTLDGGGGPKRAPSGCPEALLRGLNAPFVESGPVTGRAGALGRLTRLWAPEGALREAC